MKKSLYFLVMIFVISLVLFVGLFGCVTDNGEGSSLGVKSIAIVENNQSTFVVGQPIDLSQIKIEVKKSNDTTEIIPLDDSMMSSTDRALFSTVGVHSIKITYREKSVFLQISVEDSSEKMNYTAIFHSEGGEDVDTITTNVITDFPIPKRGENFKFVGWYVNWTLEEGVLGDKCIAPFALENHKNSNNEVHFYAKWKDNREYDIVFKNFDGSVKETIVKGYGESLDLTNLDTYTPPLDIEEGYVFESWTVVKGDVNNITEDVEIKPIVIIKSCTLIIEHAKAEEPEITSYNYGEKLDISKYQIKTKVGHTSRWVIIYNEDKAQNIYEWGDDEFVFENETTLIIKNDITIRQEYQINTYKTVISNGLVEDKQTEENKENGTLLTEQVYSESLEYGSDLNFVKKTGEKPVVEIEKITGFDAQWTIITKNDKNDDVIRNFNNLVWNKEEECFEGTSSTNFMVFDSEGNVICKIQEGNIIDIEGEIVIKPIYTKKIYTLSLYRNDTEILTTFDLPYYTKFDFYDPSNYVGESWLPLNATRSDVESYYQLHNVASWIPKNEPNYEWLSTGWDIKWYFSSDKVESEFVDINSADSKGEYGIYIKENTALYSKDIDNRLYNVSFHYNYDFGTNTYQDVLEFSDVSQYTTVNAPMVYDIEYDKTIYIGNGWRDVPFSLVDGAYEGNLILSSDFTQRTQNVNYYANYVKKTGYTISITDKTQEDIFTTASNPNGVDGMTVYNHSISYNVDSGDILDSATMLFKGRKEGDNIITSQVIFNEYNFWKNIYPNYVLKKDDILSRYSLARLEEKITEEQGNVDDYNKFLDDMHSYKYDAYTNIDYIKYMNFASDLGDTLERLNTYKNEREFLQKFDEYTLQKELYEDKGESYYKNYNTESLVDLDTIDDTDYVFEGWYVDEKYTESLEDAILANKIDGEVTQVADGVDTFVIRASKSYISIYAKWTDKKKGNEGVVYENINNEYYVVDFIDQKSPLYSTYINDNRYSITENDIGEVPASLGKNILLQIPNTHKGLPVVGIMSEALDYKGGDVIEIDLPANMRTVQEGTFKNSFLQKIVVANGNQFMYSDNYKALYQKDFSGYMLLVYASGFVATELDNATTYNVISQIDGSDVEVTRIADFAFNAGATLSEVDFGDYLVSIGRKAFNGCTKLNEINLPDSLITLEKEAFLSCINVNDIILSSNSGLSNIGENALSSTKWHKNQTGLVVLNNIMIGLERGKASLYEDDVYTDANGNKITINNARQVVKVEIVAGIDSIAEFALSDNSALYEVIVNSQLNKIGNYAFENSKSLSSISFAQNATAIIEIGESIFAGCNNLSVIFSDLSVINKQLESEEWSAIAQNHDIMAINSTILEYYSMYDRTNIVISIPSFVTAISDNVFLNRSNLIGVLLPESLLSIGENTFKGCNLNSISIPSSVVSMGLGAFSGNENLTQISLPFVGAGLNSVTNTSFAHIFAGSVPSSLVEVIICDNKTNTNTSIAESAFEDSTIDSITISKNVITIDNYAFKNSEVKVINFAEGLNSINNGVFMSCDNLKEVRLPNSLESIGEDAFKDSKRLVSVIFEVNNSILNNIGQNAFNGSGLVEIVLPNRLQNIGSGAFANCGDMIGITIPFVGESLVPTLNTSFDYIFAGSVPINLTTINIETSSVPNATISIADNAFLGVDFYNLTLPSNLVSIGESAFKGCENIKSIDIPKSVTTIANNAFSGATSLNKIIFEADCGLLTIGDYAFENNYQTGDSNVFVIPESVTYMGVNIMKGWEKLQSLTTPYLGESNNQVVNSNLTYMFGMETKSLVEESLSCVTLSNNTTIFNGAFDNWSLLEEINIDKNTTNIEGGAFYCVGATAINIDAQNPYYKVSSGTIFTNDDSTLVYSFASDKSYEVESSVLTISDYAFANNSDLENITINSTCTNIGNGILYSVNRLMQVELPFVGNSLTDGVNNGKLNTIFMGKDGVDDIANNLSITIQQGTELTQESFEGMDEITSLEMPSTMIRVYQGVLADCVKIENLTIAKMGVFAKNSTNDNDAPEFGTLSALFTNKSGQSIVPSTLKNTTILTETAVITGAFKDLNKLETITFLGVITEMGAIAFKDCSSLKKVTYHFAPVYVEGILSIFGGVHEDFEFETLEIYKSNYEQDDAWSQFIDKIIYV